MYFNEITKFIIYVAVSGMLAMAEITTTISTPTTHTTIAQESTITSALTTIPTQVIITTGTALVRTKDTTIAPSSTIIPSVAIDHIHQSTLKSSPTTPSSSALVLSSHSLKDLISASSQLINDCEYFVYRKSIDMFNCFHFKSATLVQNLHTLYRSHHNIFSTN